LKILSTSDWHLCCGMDDDISNSLVQIEEKAAEVHPNLIVIAGDINHRASDPNGRNQAAEHIQKLADIAPVLIVRGNHDAPGDLMIFARLQAKNKIWVHETPNTLVFKESESHIVAIHTMPWFTKTAWLATHKEESKESSDRAVGDLALQYIQNVVLNTPGVDVHILVAHLMINGARVQNHQPLIGQGVTVGQYDLPEAGLFAAILGHIHLKQEFTSPRFFYNGSIAALNYGETPDKYFSILDTHSGDVEWIRLNTVGRYQIDIDFPFTDDGLKNSLAGRDFIITGSRIAVNLRVPDGENVSQAKGEIERYFSLYHPIQLDIRPQLIPKTELRSQEIAHAHSLSDKLRAYWKATTEPDAESQKDMLEKL
jgi:exonuclease SbcD